MKGKLFVIPIPISTGEPNKVLSEDTIEQSKQLRFFVVEKIKTARQFLRQIDRTFPIDESQFFELNKHNDYSFDKDVLAKLNEGHNVGVMSEAGYPGIADPGNKVVQLAHKHNVKVVPLIGPSSLFLALATSGLNGQGFSFHGYLPKSEGERIQKLGYLSKEIRKNGYAQLFIETPYRNQAMFESVLKNIDNEIQLTIALDITGEKEFIKTKTIQDWRETNYQFGKAPCVFILGRL